MITRYYSKEGEGLLNYISLKSNKIDRNLPKNSRYLTYSREAIYEIMRQCNITRKDRILMPSYQCNTVIDYILPFTKNIDFYSIDMNLNFNEREIDCLIKKNTKMIFFVHYFGMISHIENSFILRLHNKGIKIVHDMAHGFLSLYMKDFKLSFHGDYVVSSMYKNMPIGTGAICIGNITRDSGMDMKEFTLINLKKILTNIRCLVGVKKFTYYELNDSNGISEDMVHYEKSILFYQLYKQILQHINLDQMIDDKMKIAKDFFDIFEQTQECKNIITKDKINTYVLQAYPVKCENKEFRQKLFDYLKEQCVDVYPWPSYHKMNDFDRLKEMFLLLPLNQFALKKTKEFFNAN